MKIAVMLAMVAMAAAGSYQAFKFTHQDRDGDMAALAQKCLGSEELKKYSADAVNLVLLNLNEVAQSGEKYMIEDEYKAHMKSWNENIYDKRRETLDDRAKRDMQSLMLDIVSHDDKLKCLSNDLAKKTMSLRKL